MKNIDSVTPTTLADAVEKKIYEYISNNNMSPGDALPKEEELAKELNVSRNIVREALSRLRMLGLVETRKKKGMTLAKPDAFIGLEKIVTANIMSPEYRKDLLGMRVILEIGMLDYVFKNKTEKDIKELKNIIEKEKRKNLSMEELQELEIAFHSKLYEISGNNALKRLQGILKPFFSVIKKNDRKKLGFTPPDHTDICEALEKGTEEEFRTVMRKHLSVYMDL